MTRTLALLFVLSGVHLAGSPETMIVRKDNFVIGATVDGYLCYGTFEPQSVDCHRAIPEPVIP